MIWLVTLQPDFGLCGKRSSRHRHVLEDVSLMTKSWQSVSVMVADPSYVHILVQSRARVCEGGVGVVQTRIWILVK